MPLEDPDGYESGANKDAAASYKRLAAVADGFNADEIALVNWLRRVYRKSVPLENHKTGGGPFVAGGSLVFNGANIRLCRDKGVFYKFFKAKAGLTKGDRTGGLSGSSHASDWDQYEIQLKGAGVFLVGMCNEFPDVPDGAHTWIQSERHAANGHWGQWVAHAADFGTHASSGYLQVGAFGTSPYSEKDVKDGRIMSGRKANPLLCIGLPLYLGT